MNIVEYKAKLTESEKITINLGWIDLGLAAIVVAVLPTPKARMRVVK